MPRLQVKGRTRRPLCYGGAVNKCKCDEYGDNPKCYLHGTDSEWAKRQNDGLLNNRAGDQERVKRERDELRDAISAARSEIESLKAKLSECRCWKDEHCPLHSVGIAAEAAKSAALKAKLDEAVKKYHAEISEGRKRCEGVVRVVESEWILAVRNWKEHKNCTLKERNEHDCGDFEGELICLELSRTPSAPEKI